MSNSECNDADRQKANLWHTKLLAGIQEVFYIPTTFGHAEFGLIKDKWAMDKDRIK